MSSNDLEILGRDKDIIAVNKPVGWVTIPGRFHNREVPVLSHALGDYLKEKIFVIHRLDQGTSGVVLFALSAEGHTRLCSQFEHNEILKNYLCIVKGRPNVTSIHQPIFKLRSKKNKSVVDPKGKPSQTEIEILKSHDEYSLIHAQPKTGRTHQIRVHLAYIGCPLVGDKLYGGPTEAAGLSLQFPLLHCQSLAYKNEDGAMVEFKISPPHLFQTVAEKLDLLESEI